MSIRAALVVLAIGVASASAGEVADKAAEAEALAAVGKYSRPSKPSTRRPE